jgi:hypothetical protein
MMGSRCLLRASRSRFALISRAGTAHSLRAALAAWLWTCRRVNTPRIDRTPLDRSSSLVRRTACRVPWGKPYKYGKKLVGDTGFEPMTSSVSVISGAHDNAAVGVSEVRGCTQMIAGRRTD